MKTHTPTLRLPALAGLAAMAALPAAAKEEDGCQGSKATPAPSACLQADRRVDVDLTGAS